VSIQLKLEFNVVKDLRATSGFSWDDQEQCVRASREVWDAYIKVGNALPAIASPRECSTQTHPMANKFRKKPFLLYDTIAYLVDETQTTGKNAFRAGHKSAFKHERSQPWFVLQVQSQRGRLSHLQLYLLTQRLIQDDEMVTPRPRRTTASAPRVQVLLQADARRCAACPLIVGCPKWLLPRCAT
jgi:hypothetical protein